MLLTLIYRSHMSDQLHLSSLNSFISLANIKNSLSEITGILLFDGTHFIQLLEGPELAVDSLFKVISQDNRHHNVVELMRDFAPERRFGRVGMEIFDLRELHDDTVIQAILDRGTSKFQRDYDDRALQFLYSFVQARENKNYFDIPPSSAWTFLSDPSEKPEWHNTGSDTREYNFAFQPIIDPLSRKIVSFEASLRSADGGPAMRYYSQLSRMTIYQADLKSKKLAFSLAARMGIEETPLVIKLLPMTLVLVPDAVDFLLQEIINNGLVPEQVIVAITENGAITREKEFAAAIKQLKSAGMKLAIDDFGAGSAGLLLLTQIQPDKLMIDRNIIYDVHKSGAKQAIVQSIISFCISLKISVIATGVSQVEEWMWLEAAGILHFQGELFSAPRMNGEPPIQWPEKTA